MKGAGRIGRALRGLLLSLAALSCGPSFADEAGVLLWMVDEVEIVDRGLLGEYVSPEGYRATAARVVARDSEGTAVYLNLSYDAGDGSFVETDVSLATLTSDYRAGPLWASLSGVQDSVESYAFAIELGTMVEGTWTILALSDALTFTQLENFIQYDSMMVPAEIWAPHSYSVPEPSSGLLVVVGVALLALRRKERRS